MRGRGREGGRGRGSRIPPRRRHGVPGAATQAGEEPKGGREADRPHAEGGRTYRTWRTANRKSTGSPARRFGPGAAGTANPDDSAAPTGGKFPAGIPADRARPPAPLRDLRRPAGNSRPASPRIARERCRRPRRTPKPRPGRWHSTRARAARRCGRRRPRPKSRARPSATGSCAAPGRASAAGAASAGKAGRTGPAGSGGGGRGGFSRPKPESRGEPGFVIGRLSVRFGAICGLLDSRGFSTNLPRSKARYPPATWDSKAGRASARTMSCGKSPTRFAERLTPTAPRGPDAWTRSRAVPPPVTLWAI